MLIPVYLRGSSYYLYTRVNGVQFKRSLQTNNKAIAIMRASRLIEALVKIDLSGIRTYEIDLKNGVLKSEGVDDNARMLEALTHLKSSASLRVTRRIVSQSALAGYQPEEFKPGVQFQTDEDLACLAGDIAATIFHPVGTTKMGRDDDVMAVVDSHLRVRGIRGLGVVDAGVMPLITSGNTNSPTLMIAEKAAEWIQVGV